MNHLSDVSFVLPVRIDSQERSRNLDLVLDFIMRHFDSQVMVLEADGKRRFFPKNTGKQLQYHFVEDHSQVFYHTRYLNCLYRMVDTPIIALWDTDIIIPPHQVIETAERVRQGKTVMGLPYNGYAYQTTEELVKKYQQSPDLKIFEEVKCDLRPMYGKLSVGGAFLADAAKYKQAGGENENFTDWGPEDIERVKRIEILYHPLTVYRAEGFLYHLCHPRNNSGYKSLQTKIRFQQELLKVCGMKQKELKRYVDSWKKNNKNRTQSATRNQPPDNESDIYGVILMLHRVVEERSPLAVNRELEVTPAFLEQTILKYKSAGYRFVSLDEVQQQVESREHAQHKFVCFTFDDGYADNYKLAYPIFKKHNCPFAIYIATDFPDKKALLWWYHLQEILLENERLELNGVAYDCSDTEKKNQTFKAIRLRLFNDEAETTMKALEQLFRKNACSTRYDVNKLALSWEQIVDMSADPLCTIAAHTVSHPSLPTLSDEEIRKELSEGKKKIEDYIRKPVKHFAYPFGNCDNRVAKITMEQFSTAVLAYGGSVQKKDTIDKLRRSILLEM